MRLERLLAVARKEVWELKRDPFLVRIVVLLPVVMLLLFGYAINFTFRHMPLAVLDHAQDRTSRILIGELTRDEAFRPFRVPDRASLEEAIRLGRAWAGIEIPKGMLEKLRRKKTVRLRVWIDGSYPVAAFQVQARLRQAVARFNARVLGGWSLVEQVRPPPVSLDLKILYNPELKTTIYMIPGVVGLILTQIAVLLTALVIVRERETGMLEALLSTPIRPLEVVAGKVLPYLILSGLDAALVLWLGMVIFKVPMRGSWALLSAFLFFFVLGSLGVGILVSTRTRTQIQAIFAGMVYYLPAIFFSGLFFPIEGMPKLLQWLTYLVPLRYFLEAARGIMLKGLGIEALWFPLVAMVIFGVGTLLLGALSFQKRLG